jgi:hypothetical protein
MTVQEMFRTHPSGAADDALVRAVQEIFDCAQTCTACADACLGEESVAELVTCIRLNLDCADVCEATGRILTRQTAFDPAMARTMLETCIEACRRCGEECARHADHHEHCRICAEACNRCRQACEEALSTIGS